MYLFNHILGGGSCYSRGFKVSPPPTTLVVVIGTMINNNNTTTHNTNEVGEERGVIVW